MKRPVHLFSSQSPGLSLVREAQQTRRPMAVFLDYDGTLVDIKKIPSRVFLNPSMKRLLQHLQLRYGVFIALITGRSLNDITKLTSMRDIPVAANHGLQIRFHRFTWTHPKALQCVSLLQEIAIRLKHSLALIPGALLENKELDLAIHYRNSDSQGAKKIKQMVVNVMKAFDSTLKTMLGKKVIEIQPNISWNKGNAVSKLIDLAQLEHQTLLVYFGDDQTDEDVFEALGSKGITVRVGKSQKTSAHYFVNDPSEVRKFLEWCNGHGYEC